MLYKEGHRITSTEAVVILMSSVRTREPNGNAIIQSQALLHTGRAYELTEMVGENNDMVFVNFKIVPCLICLDSSGNLFPPPLLCYICVIIICCVDKVVGNDISSEYCLLCTVT